MQLKFVFVFTLVIITCRGFAQNIGIGTSRPDSSAALDITAADKGMLVPRMSLAAINAILRPAKGLLAYDSVGDQLMVNVGTPAIPNWQSVTGSNGGEWSLDGNRGTDPRIQFIGTRDKEPLRFRVNNIPAGELNPATGNIFWGLHAGNPATTGFSNIGIGLGALQLDSTNSNLVAIGDSALNSNTSGTGNMAIGAKALLANTVGSSNTALGSQALAANLSGGFNTATGTRALASNISGGFNVANGEEALVANISGAANVAIGFQSLFNSTNASGNTAVGTQTLLSNTTGASNSALGANALFSNTTGNFNIAGGVSALFFNTTGNDNTAFGFNALLGNGTGRDNTAIGSKALFSNFDGHDNIAIGQLALASNSSGFDNVAIGNGALGSNQKAGENVAVGVNALAITNGAFSDDNTAVGANAGSRFALGEFNTLIGASADAWGNGAQNCVALGAFSQCTQDNQVMLGNTSTLSITGFADFSKLSDGRFKKNIREDVQGLGFIMKLRPVTYQVDITALNAKMGVKPGKQARLAKSNAEAEQIVHSGFIAQEVEQAAKDLHYDFSGVDRPQREGGLYALRYAEFVVPLVKAVQEQELLIDGLRKRQDGLVNEVAGAVRSDADQQKAFEDLTRRIQRLEASIPVKN